MTPNDVCDADTGPNNLQNFPVITSAPIAAGNVAISGTLNSTASTTFRVEFFSNATADPSGHGEGQMFLGFANVTTNASCNVSFGPFTFAVPPGQTIFSATATDPANNTSEFSVAFAAAASVAPPTIAKSFGGASTPLNGSTSLSFTLNNPNASPALTGVGFTDTLPAGLVVSLPTGLTGSCGGGTITATAGSGSVSLTGAALAGNASCTFSVNVTGTTAGTKNNTTGAVTSVEGGAGGTASASVNVVAGVVPPTIAESFGTGSIALNASTSLSFTINNPNVSTTLTGIGFTDTLPAGLVLSTPNGLTGTCGGGAISATAGSGSLSLTGATLASSASCTFSVSVTGTTLGTKNNATSTVSSTEGGPGAASSASVTVAAAGPALPPTNIPTLQQWALWLLALLILIVTTGVMSRQRGRGQR